MKIGITSVGKDLYANVDSGFEKANYLVIYNQERDTWDFRPNTQSVADTDEIGIQAGQSLVETGAKVLITGHVGPKAFKVLNTERIIIYSIGDESYTLENALAAFRARKLTTLTAPNALDII